MRYGGAPSGALVPVRHPHALEMLFYIQPSFCNNPNEKIMASLRYLGVCSPQDGGQRMQTTSAADTITTTTETPKNNTPSTAFLFVVVL